MRVGNCFSRVLNPARPPLFGDEEGCAPLPDEGWPGSLPAPMRKLCNMSDVRRMPQAVCSCRAIPEQCANILSRSELEAAEGLENDLQGMQGPCFLTFLLAHPTLHA